MAHTDFTTIPVVDIAGLHSPDPVARQAVADELGRAARDVGFLMVTGHGISRALRDGLLEQARAFFARPLDEKMRVYIGQSTNHSGYVPEGEEQFAGGSRDLKEAYDVNYDYTDGPQRFPLLGPNQWPDSPAFRDKVGAYYRAALALGDRLFAGFALALGLPEDTFVPITRQPTSQLRLIHYPLDTDPAADRPGIGAHTDYECFTILLPTAEGLQVQNGAGEWIEVPLVEDAFVINIGDMLEVLSNGQFVATAHRVRKVAEERFAFPLFCACDYDTRIAPIEGLAPRGERQYTPVICGDHLYAQTAQTFRYLRERLEVGELKLPEGSLGLSSFGPGRQGVGA
ncbi:isopenicillin N synthase family dioxygenase [Stutzerimonas balearica]|uniref:2OG-Fe(II) oxygenase n=1 Tax=Stutzerimonas balearica DSM 6083 TaxID=1123016 RepID=A0A8D3XY35_9GAMM|nr:2-oxoglutarate and iron-dependent oxygenase domain-containing protein [Stutzerimonas balearica]AJE13616.1 2OG-Fe(II) oxygenase [Stutzerimonas balearica DSM 6083]SDL92562.1 Isopenicillin N synthase [Stutzerimonas balearica DSM 6083]